MNTLGISVDAWAAWAPGIVTHEDWKAWNQGEKGIEPGEKPVINFVPPMYRRRLSFLGKMAVMTANQCVPSDSENCSTRYVFASRYGENARTMGIINNIVQGDDVSPTAFSLSVHNAIAGVYSIINKQTQPSVSISAGRNTFMSAWVEAEQLLHSTNGGAESVMLIYYDEPLAEDLAKFNDDIQMPFSISMRLSKAKEGMSNISLMSESQSQEQQNALSDESQALTFLRFLLTQEQTEVACDSKSNWVWNRSANN